jgi:hypothetical protein
LVAGTVKFTLTVSPAATVTEAAVTVQALVAFDGPVPQAVIALQAPNTRYRPADSNRIADPVHVTASG